MRTKTRWLCLSLTVGLLAGCDQYAERAEDIGRVEQAVNICDETVPANRYVDGIPAYAQCTAAENSPIYSNNGVDTSTTSGGTGWVRTQYSGGYQCTELAHRYLYFHWNVTWIPNGNAGTWCDTTPPSNSGVVQTMSPVHGDVIVFPPGSCGASTTAGHVALVDTVNSATQVTIVEQNGANRRNCNISCAACFLHVVANTGTGGSGGASGTGGSATGGRATGGTAPATGGRATGGTAPATGGRATGGTATGGTITATGGTASATGGTTPAAGGTISATGGSTPATGGATPSTGGTTPSIGGTTPGSGGTATGATPSSGGQTAQAGQGTAGTGGEPDPAETCSCRVASHQGGATPRPLGLAALALLGLWKRRRSPRTRREPPTAARRHLGGCPRATR